jgi:hypothetical protein
MKKVEKVSNDWGSYMRSDENARVSEVSDAARAKINQLGLTGTRSL